MRYFCLYLIVGICAHVARAQDSLPSFSYAKPVTIVDSASVKNQLLHSDLHDHVFAGDLGSVLTKQTTLNIAQYGGPGSASLIRAQGLAPDHTALMWGNLPLNSISLGQADCSLIPVFFFDEITGSPFYQRQFKSSSLAGDITLSRTKQQNVGYSWVQEWNSLNNQFYGIRLNEKIKKSFLDIRVFHQILNNEFSYRDDYHFERPIRKQDHNNARGNGLSLRASIPMTNKRWLIAEYWLVERDAHLPQRMGSSSNRLETQNDIQQRGKLQWSGTDDRWTHQLSWLHDGQRYYSGIPGAEESDVQSDLEGARIQWTSEYDQQFGKKSDYHLHGGLAAVHQFVNYNDGNRPEESFLGLQFSLSKAMGNDQFKLSGSYETRENKPFPDLLFSYRNSLITEQNIHLVGTLESGIQSRVPDFNERYWRPGGNPDLLPEINRTFRGGFEFHYQNQLKKDFLRIELKPYYNRVTNWIQWIPDQDGYWRPKNYKEVWVHGIKTSAEGTFSVGEASLTINQSAEYCQSRTIHQDEKEEVFSMVYTPEWISRSGLTLHFHSLEMGCTYQYTSARYTDEENTENLKLPSYDLLNVYVGWRLTQRASDTSIRLKCDNALNEQYQSVRLYAMPGRVYSISLVLNIKNNRNNEK